MIRRFSDAEKEVMESELLLNCIEASAKLRKAEMALTDLGRFEEAARAAELSYSSRNLFYWLCEEITHTKIKASSPNEGADPSSSPGA